ncbi:hypothetical protein ABID99_002324 [Mucilaginibacter sp. OAE612]|uniref:hypothetical protein n=1 Tax=Mucilaginibacter sp. OAE612 TaxID=3156444 RepID=UPI00359ED513
MTNPVKSGKEILDDFFAEILNISDVDSAIAQCLADLYGQNKLTDTNVKNELQKLREKNGNKN